MKKNILVLLVTLISISVQAEEVIRCEGAKDQLHGAGISSSMVLRAQSDDELTEDGNVVSYELTLKEKNKVVRRLDVTLKYAEADAGGNPDRYEITSQKKGLAEGTIIADLSNAFISFSGEVDGYSFKCDRSSK